ncbi:amino acid/polyamine/organocation transporter, APC superfamily [Kytococcus aerolatus]|uniref:Amino acid/polyamine/organocation transporter, APC superfamily n=1 Tax=Kytococcus aerolatus TaxID=592308 RepID=A0A212T4D6_9MICO|nr:APC family permease [Kytococcus aerolatus]SNC60634.1 amino acid/polyamine/organocation transporter, APC superfamily [Kytococcus aerolatus]
MSTVSRDAAPAEARSSTGEVDTELKRVMTPKLLLLFIIGDILGTGIYAITGKVAGEVGGAVWVPFLIAFAIAIVTAFAYLELITKYPHAGGAANFIHQAFGINFLTFMVTFTVMASGITSASTAAKAFAANLAAGIGADWAPEGTAVLLLAVAFMLVVGLVNFRGVAESIWLNVVLTIIELTGLLLVIFVGLWAVTGMSGAEVDFSRAMMFETEGDKNAFLAATAGTSLAFFAMVGFEDSVNMAEETKDPVKTFPKIMLTGLLITAVIYVLVSVTAVALVPVGELKEGDTPLLQVVQAGAPNLPIDTIYPFIAMFAVANTAVINMLMASRLLYGMANQEVLPRQLALVHKGRQSPWVAIIVTTLLAVGLITFVGKVSALGGTTALLLLAVFALVNIACIVLRKRDHEIGHEFFRAPSWLPWVGAAACLYMLGPWTGRDPEQYVVAGWLMLIALVLFAITWFLNRALYAHPTKLRHPEQLPTQREFNHHNDPR